MISDPNFPRLTSNNHRITSPATFQDNCIGWTAGDTNHWWQPGIFWPIETTEDNSGIEALETAFAYLGYERTVDDGLESEFENIALYASSVYYTHASRQLANGKWTSKLGRAEDIEHELPGDVGGGIYGEVISIMKRPIKQS